MEETQVEQATITVDGEEYIYDILSDTAKVSIKHIQKLDADVDDLNFKLDEAKVARLGFLSILKNELVKKEA